MYRVKKHNNPEPKEYSSLIKDMNNLTGCAVIVGVPSCQVE